LLDGDILHESVTRLLHPYSPEEIHAAATDGGSATVLLVVLGIHVLVNLFRSHFELHFFKKFLELAEGQMVCLLMLFKYTPRLVFQSLQRLLVLQPIAIFQLVGHIYQVLYLFPICHQVCATIVQLQKQAELS
jgi:hypothetical protein